LPLAEARPKWQTGDPTGSKPPLSQAAEAQAAAEKGESGRSCCRFDILLRTRATKGKLEMKKTAREINTASKPSGDGCAECLASPTGWWFHLRRCAECGHIGCCDSSPSQHASKHAAAAGHPIITSFEPGEDWFFDYKKQATVKCVELLPPHSHPGNQPAPGPAGRVPANWESLLN